MEGCPKSTCVCVRPGEGRECRGQEGSAQGRVVVALLRAAPLHNRKGVILTEAC